ncbi:MAG TPA: autotransporter outer membrane beta-barrel domain-containing protein [Caulobacter sp.]|nr:autotransporter outer membrane beta-barrel domain-containing protein [Caulobacter sp.]
MFRRSLVASVAAAPLLLFASAAFAQTEIDDEDGVPVATSTAGDVVVTDEGEIVLTAPGAAITVDSDNTVLHEGLITAEDVDGTTGILVQGGVTTTITHSGSIMLVDEEYDVNDTDNDTDEDGDLDGRFSVGSNRYGIRVTGPGTVTGNLFADYASGITVDGNDSFGISLESALDGDLISRGSITVTGDNSMGLRVGAAVTGDVEVSGSISVQGDGAVGAAIDADVSGGLHIQGSVTAYGYRYTTRPDEEARDLLDADDLLQGGPAVRITASVAGGVRLDGPADTDADFDNDGITDSADEDVDGDGIDDEDDTDLDNDGITDDDYDNDGKDNDEDKDDDNDGVEDDDEDEDGVYDLDDNGDGIPDDDLDQDGRADTSEGSANLTVYGGSPALLIGSESQDIAIGAVGTGDEAYGLLIRGNIVADGVYDDIDATGVRIGGEGGFATLLEGGLRNEGYVSATAYDAESRALDIAAGADVETLVNDGVLYSSARATSAPLAEEAETHAVAIRIDEDASVASFFNSGTVSALSVGEASNATALIDESGGLTHVENTGTILAAIYADDDEDDTDDDNEDSGDEDFTGRAVAVDVSKSTSGVTILQYAALGDRDGDGILDGADADRDGDGLVDDEDEDFDNDGVADDDPEDDEDDLDEDGDGLVDSQEPLIQGDVLLGSGDDSIDLRNGALIGNIAFGDGADRLTVGSADGYAQVTGDLTDSDGRLDIDLANGALTVTNTETIQATSLAVAGSSALTVTADPGAGSVTTFQVSTASFSDGATLGLKMLDLIDGPTRYVIVHTDTPGGLTVEGLDTNLDEDSPYLFVVTAGSDATAGEVYLDVRRRTAEEMGLSENQALAMDAVYAALNGDEDVRDAFLGAETQDDFIDLYEQMMPDQGEGLFSAIDVLTRSVTRLTASRPNLSPTYGPDSFWVQEINLGVNREAGLTAGSETKAFGFVAGYESMGVDGGALGTTLAFMNAEEKDEVAQAGEETSISLLEAGVYWRRSIGGWTFNLRGSGGYAWLDGDRLFVDPDTGLVVQADSNWNGYLGVASAGTSYEGRLGRYYVRPTVSVDYLYFHEGERVESRGGDAFNQTVQARDSSRLSALAELTFGATYGRDSWWRPELRVGYRQHLAGQVDDTTFRFTNGAWVTLPASAPGDGAVLIGFSLQAGTSMSHLAVEGDYEAVDGEDRYSLRMSGRMMF